MAKRHPAPVPYKAALNTPLRRWRQREGLTWDDVVERTGVKKRTLLRIGEGYSCTVAIARALSRATRLPMWVWLEGTR